MDIEIESGAFGRFDQQQCAYRMPVRLRTGERDIAAIDLQLHFVQRLFRRGLICSRCLLAELETDLRFVPVSYLNTTVTFSGDGERLVGNGAGFFTANTSAVIVVIYAQVLRTIVAIRIVQGHRDVLRARLSGSQHYSANG